MQRLVYTPRAYVFTKDSKGNIRDVSRYVTEGSVTRKVQEVSRAEITLRNPDMIFTTPDQDGHVAFHPMDPITIYLKRLRKRPVRVFTGFLDKTPYLQLFPGVIRLRASCTLKRLLYTFFDPALPYMQSFLAAYGWMPDPQNSGQWFSFGGMDDFRTDKKAVDQKLGNLNDGSVGNLLFATLKYIGHWSEDDIYIEALPDGLFKRLANLAQEMEQDNDQLKQEFDELMRRIVGSGSYGDGGGDGADLSGIDGDVPVQVYRVGRRMGVGNNSKLMLAAMMTGLVEAPTQGGNSFGNPSGGDLTGQPGAPASRKSAGWRQETEGAYPGVDRTNVPEAAKRFFTEGKNIQAGKSPGKAGMGMYSESWTPGNLAQAIQGSAYPDKYDAVRSKAETLLRQCISQASSSEDAGPTQPGQATDPDRVVRASRRDGRDDKNSGSEKGTRYEAMLAEANRMDKLAKAGLKYSNARPPSDTQGYDCSSSCSQLLRAAGYKIEGWPATNSIWQYMKPGKDPSGRLTFWNSGTATAGNSVHIFADFGGKYWTTAGGLSAHWEDNYHGPIAGFKPFHMAGMDEPADVPRNADTSLSGGGANADAGSSSDPAMSAGAAAFMASIEMPTMLEAIEATALSGQKSLLNDKPLMPFVQQLVEAGFRQFQSLPDGKFFAFYPDYFGEMFHRPPYWEIDDIEVMDGGVELSDDALVTHMYVVGDTTFSQNETMNRIFSSGVVSVFNAFMSEQMLDRRDDQDQRRREQAKDFSKGKDFGGKNDPRGMDKLLDKDEAVTFLQRYGARPLTEDMPMVKHPYFEMFLAYQKFLLAWSKQFITPFTFTFMPELYPGGKVGFPEHGLQMYIEEVTHSWSYESGFTTQAQLSAPSVYVSANGVAQNPLGLPANMVRAIIKPTEKK